MTRNENTEYTTENNNRSQKQFLELLARKLGIKESSLETLTSFGKALDEINQRRTEIQNSDMPYREAATLLAELDSREKAILLELDSLKVTKKRSPLKGIITATAITGGVITLGVILSKLIASNDAVSDDESDDADNGDEDENEEDGLETEEEHRAEGDTQE
ncbi:MAG: hypothetical protein FWG89_11470 [Treponema sp.]|nr:hypothetical protein [Treponema sp.]